MTVNEGKLDKETSISHPVKNELDRIDEEVLKNRKEIKRLFKLIEDENDRKRDE